MDNKIVEIETNKLDFDPKNPRFFRLNDASNAATVIEEMLDDESVHDLMLSIGQQGYFPRTFIGSKKQWKLHRG